MGRRILWGGGPARDGERDAVLRAHGYEVLRFLNSDVMRNPDSVYDVVVAALAGKVPPSERR